MSKEERCPNCERLQKLIVQLQTQGAQQAARIEELERKLAAATKNSGNGSKPPSSDIVKPTSKKKPVGKRKKGGQKGHSRGLLAKVIGKVSEAIAPLYEGLFEQLKVERVLNIDETGHRDSGKRMWTWCFRANGFTLFHIDASRGSKVLLEVLGD